MKIKSRTIALLLVLLCASASIYSFAHNPFVNTGILAPVEWRMQASCCPGGAPCDTAAKDKGTKKEENTKTAAKKTGHATAKAADKTADAAEDTGHAAKASSKKTGHTTAKAADKTEDAAEGAAKKTGHGTKKGTKGVGHGVKKGAAKAADTEK